MTDKEKITKMVIHKLQSALHAASRDYFMWSSGHVLYDRGVEALIQVYAAKLLFEWFSPQHKVTLHLERPCIELVPGLGGRIDMTLEFDGGFFYAVEFKRYSNPAQIGSDLARLREITAAAGGVGLLAAPCYMKERENDYDWPLRQKRENEEKSPGQIWHLSDKQSLPAPGHLAGWSHERALVVQV